MPALSGDPAALLGAVVLKLPALLVAVTVHEVAHGLVADRLGDPTARLRGRLTLNPLPHIDPLGALTFVVAGFGWAKPVPVDVGNLRHPVRDMAWVAAAGPASNFVVAFLGLLAFAVAQRTAGVPLVSGLLAGVLLWVYRFNLALAIFNLIPLPPLDGGHFLPYVLPRRAGRLLRELERYGPILLVVILLSGAAGFVLDPVFRWVSAIYVAFVKILV
jgi:Zn-dependent protease